MNSAWPRCLDKRYGGFTADRVAVGHYHLQTLLGERQGGCPANAGRRAGNQATWPEKVMLIARSCDGMVGFRA